MNISAVGIKAEIYITDSANAVGAGASWLGIEIVLSIISAETALSTNFEAIEHDGSTWSALEDWESGTSIKPDANDLPSHIGGVGFANSSGANRVRIRNSAGASNTMRIMGWYLV